MTACVCIVEPTSYYRVATEESLKRLNRRSSKSAIEVAHRWLNNNNNNNNNKQIYKPPCMPREGCRGAELHSKIYMVKSGTMSLFFSKTAWYNTRIFWAWVLRSFAEQNLKLGHWSTAVRPKTTTPVGDPIVHAWTTAIRAARSRRESP